MQARNFDNHFKDLFENTSDLIHFLSIDGKIEVVNPSWLKTLEYQMYEVVGRSIFDFLHPDFSNAYKACRDEAISNKTTCDVEVVFVTKHGKTIIGEGQIGCSYNKDSLFCFGNAINY